MDRRRTVWGHTGDSLHCGRQGQNGGVARGGRGLEVRLGSTWGRLEFVKGRRSVPYGQTDEDRLTGAANPDHGDGGGGDRGVEGSNGDLTRPSSLFRPPKTTSLPPSPSSLLPSSSSITTSSPIPPPIPLTSPSSSFDTKSPSP